MTRRLLLSVEAFLWSKTNFVFEEKVIFLRRKMFFLRRKCVLFEGKKNLRRKCTYLQRKRLFLRRKILFLLRKSSSEFSKRLVIKSHLVLLRKNSGFLIRKLQYFPSGTAQEEMTQTVGCKRAVLHLTVLFVGKNVLLKDDLSYRRKQVDWVQKTRFARILSAHGGINVKQNFFLKFCQTLIWQLTDFFLCKSRLKQSSVDSER